MATNRQVLTAEHRLHDGDCGLWYRHESNFGRVLRFREDQACIRTVAATENAKRQTLTAIQALVVPFVMRINGATMPTAIAATIRRQMAANASVSVTRAVAAAAPVCTI